ncbi:Sec1 family domain-containing protein 2 isoform X3 [Oopsacas minuta]|uniref:Sec1 family domain-containing protein 2 isoform X3 n=1 Tax=Oopsacas minuta TaxID=111878 RepID=A0AAV7K7J3_9METZ|nr:Sec1 family domain-containing protein 2 isoform X3 [Oopsacas minuta]
MYLSRYLSNISADILNKNVSQLLLDEATAELIHWQTTRIHVDILPHISNQPQNLKIYILEEVLSGKSPPSTDEAAVFLLSSPLLQSTLISLNSYISKISASTIICQNTALYKQLNESLIKTTADVDIYHINCSNINIAPDIHLIPAYNTQPAIRSDIYYWQGAETTIGGKIEPNNISASYKLELQVLSEHILCLCSELGVTPDVFSIGSSSRVLAKNIISVIREDEPTEFGKKASLILIDRTLDMATVLSHCGDNLLDRVCGCFPDWCDDSSDVRINMSRMFSEKYITPNYVPGCLSQPNNIIAQNLIKSLATLRPQEVLLEIVASLLDGLKKMGHKSPLPQRLGRITSTHLSALLEAYSKLDIADIARHAGELQIAEACIGCLEGGERSREWDTMQSREKLLTLVLTQDTDAQSVNLQLKEIVDNSNNLSQLLTTLLYVMLSSSEIVVREVEEIMKEEMVNKIVEGGENFLECLSDELKRIARNKASLRLWLNDILIRFK